MTFATPLVCPFTVVVDTREQLGYSFAGLVSDAREGRRPLAVPTVRGTLRAGDYSIQRFDHAVAVERKSLADLFGTLSRGRSRFMRELERLNAMAAAWVVVEAEWSEILAAPPARTRVTGKTVFRSVTAWQCRYPRVHWWFVAGRRLGEVVTFRLLERFWREQVAAGTNKVGGVE